jgi:hypothetical protein
MMERTPLPRVGLDARCELMVEVTLDTLHGDPDLRLCEGLRLIEATRTAVARLAPTVVDDFDRVILPTLRQVLMDRFGVSELPPGPVN